MDIKEQTSLYNPDQPLVAQLIPLLDPDATAPCQCQHKLDRHKPFLFKNLGVAVSVQAGWHFQSAVVTASATPVEFSYPEWDLRDHPHDPFPMTLVHSFEVAVLKIEADGKTRPMRPAEIKDFTGVEVHKESWLDGEDLCGAYLIKALTEKLLKDMKYTDERRERINRERMNQS